MTTVVTKARGGTAKPVGLLYGEPDRRQDDAGRGTAIESSGLDAAVVADLLSACLAHERCGVHLYRSVAARVTDPDLQERFMHFLGETEQHVEHLESLVEGAGGNPAYVSPAARATEKAAAGLLESTFLLAGSVDTETADLAMLEAVMLAEAKDHANWETLVELADAMAPGDLRDQFASVAAAVLAQEEEHYEWARTTRAELLAFRAGASPAVDAREGGAR